MDNEQLMQALSGLLDEKLQPIKDRLGKIEGRLDKIEGRLDNVEGRLDNVEGRLDKMKDRLDKIEGRLDKVEGHMDKMEGRLNVVEVLQRRTTKKLDDLRLDMMVFQGNVRQDIYDLGDQMETVVEILKINEILPR